MVLIKPYQSDWLKEKRNEDDILPWPRRLYIQMDTYMTLHANTWETNMGPSGKAKRRGSGCCHGLQCVIHMVGRTWPPSRNSGTSEILSEKNVCLRWAYQTAAPARMNCSKYTQHNTRVLIAANDLLQQDWVSGGRRPCHDDHVYDTSQSMATSATS